MKKRIKSERLIYVRHPVMERLIILFQALSLYLFVIPLLRYDVSDWWWYYHNRFDADLKVLHTLFTSLSFVLLVIYAFLNMRPQDRKGKDPSFNFATALVLEFVRSIFKFFVLGLFAPITIFLIRADFKGDDE